MEIFEFKSGKWKYKREHRVQSISILGIAEKSIGTSIFLVHIKNKKAELLEQPIKN